MPELGHQLPFGNPPALAVGRCQSVVVHLEKAVEIVEEGDCDG